MRDHWIWNNVWDFGRVNTEPNRTQILWVISMLASTFCVLARKGLILVFPSMQFCSIFSSSSSDAYSLVMLKFRPCGHDEHLNLYDDVLGRFLFATLAVWIASASHVLTVCYLPKQVGDACFAHSLFGRDLVFVLHWTRLPTGIPTFFCSLRRRVPGHLLVVHLVIYKGDFGRNRH